MDLLVIWFLFGIVTAWCQTCDGENPQARVFVVLTKETDQRGFCFTRTTADLLIRKGAWRLRKKDGYYLIHESGFSGYDERPYEYHGVPSLLDWLKQRCRED